MPKEFLGKVEMKCAHPLASRQAEGGQGHKNGFESSEEGVLASTQGRRQDTLCGNQELWPGFVLTLPDPGCTSYLTFFVSQGHYLKHRIMMGLSSQGYYKD